MGGIINGIVLSGLTRAYGGTFMVFADYMRPAVRLAALMNLPSIFVWSHDSIGVGEDGPTHQPVEHLASLRAIPNLDVVRPADANETSVAWGEILRRTDRPAGIILSRQDLRIVARGDEYSSAEGVARGGYVLKEASDKPRLILIASGSEVAWPSRPPRNWRRTTSPPVWCPCPARNGSTSRTPNTASRCCPRT